MSELFLRKVDYLSLDMGTISKLSNMLKDIIDHVKDDTNIGRIRVLYNNEFISEYLSYNNTSGHVYLNHNIPEECDNEYIIYRDYDNKYFVIKIKDENTSLIISWEKCFIYKDIDSVIDTLIFPSRIENEFSQKYKSEVSKYLKSELNKKDLYKILKLRETRGLINTDDMFIHDTDEKVLYELLNLMTKCGEESKGKEMFVYFKDSKGCEYKIYLYVKNYYTGNGFIIKRAIEISVHKK